MLHPRCLGGAVGSVQLLAYNAEGPGFNLYKTFIFHNDMLFMFFKRRYSIFNNLSNVNLSSLVNILWSFFMLF